jgi:hypothetical protein
MRSHFHCSFSSLGGSAHISRATDVLCLMYSHSAADVVRLAGPLLPFVLPIADAIQHAHGYLAEASRRQPVPLWGYACVPHWPAKSHLNSLPAAIHGQNDGNAVFCFNPAKSRMSRLKRKPAVVGTRRPLMFIHRVTFGASSKSLLMLMICSLEKSTRAGMAAAPLQVACSFGLLRRPR